MGIKNIGFALILGILMLCTCTPSSPPITQLNDLDIDWEAVSNPDWDATELQDAVIRLAREYRGTHDQAVCWDMALGLYDVLGTNGITSIFGVSKNWVYNYDRISYVLNHVWIVVLGNDGLVVPIEYAIPRFPGDPSYEKLITGFFYPGIDSLK